MPLANDPVKTPLANAANLTELVEAASEITEVQIKLLRCELVRWRRQVLVPGLLFIMALAIVFSCVPLLLLAMALTFANLAEVSLPLSLLVVSGITAIIGNMIVLCSWLWIRELPSPLRHLKRQLFDDVLWLKSRFVR
jgi:hypothetical protein